LRLDYHNTSLSICQRISGKMIQINEGPQHKHKKRPHPKGYDP